MEWPQRRLLALLAELDKLTQLRRLTLLWIVGGTALGLVTLLSFKLDLDFAAAAFALLIVIVVLSLLDSFISSVLFSVIAFGCLNFFFVTPVFSFRVTGPQDLITLAAFLVTSLAVTTLIRRVRAFGDMEREQACLLDLTPDAVLVRDTDDVVTYWNRGAETLYGWSRQEALGKVTHQLLQTEFPVPLTEIREALLRTDHWEGELVHTTRGGSRVIVACRWSLQRNDRGEAIGTLETNTDVTERKRTEEALRRSQAAYLAEAQKLSGTGSFGWNVESGEIFWSEETFRIFELDPASVPSLETVLERTHPDDRTLVQESLERAQATREAMDVEHRLLMPDGRVKHLHVVGHADTSNGPQFIGAISDVTARKEAFAALEQSERRYRDVFDHMPIGLLQINVTKVEALFQGLRAQGVSDLGAYLDQHPEVLWQAIEGLVIEEVNDHTMRIYGAKTPEEMRGPSTRLWDVGYETLRRTFENRYRGERFFQEETKNSTLDGRVIDILFTVARPLATPGKSLVGVIDITDRVRAQEMLTGVQADFAHAARVSVLGELTASIAHEVNQPLAAIVANGQVGLRWLDRPDIDRNDLREIAQSIVADAQRAATIISRIRAMAAREAPQQALVSLDDIIREALVFLGPEIQSRGVTISHQRAAAFAPLVLGDRTQLQQVIVNLVVNAMQAMEQTERSRRRIAIRTSSPDAATVRCTVEDSGPGIAPDHQARLFESFFTTKAGGMGMGLPICRSILEAHGGEITADSNGAGGGVRVAFTLPAATPDGAPDGASRTAADGGA